MAEEKITIYPNINDALKSVEGFEEELNNHYFVCLCVDKDTDDNFTDECRCKTINWYKEKYKNILNLFKIPLEIVDLI